MEVVKTICHKVAIIHGGRLIEQGEVAWFFSHAKTELARDFIRSTIHLPIPDEFQARLTPERTEGSWPLLRLGFTGETIDSPLISETSRRFGVDICILSADIEYAGGSVLASCWQSCLPMPPPRSRPLPFSKIIIQRWR